ncbi:TPA: hypothetical protein ACNBOT_004752, partial [Escherichia coli]|nr:hypothetical protein [Escherichia coli]
ELNGITYQACRGDFVVRLDGSTCLQLWNKEGRVVCLEGDPLEVAQWLQACHDAGIEVRVQINESRGRLRKRNLWSLPFLQHRF